MPTRFPEITVHIGGDERSSPADQRAATEMQAAVNGLAQVTARRPSRDATRARSVPVELILLAAGVGSAFHATRMVRAIALRHGIETTVATAAAEPLKVTGVDEQECADWVARLELEIHWSDDERGSA